MHSSGLRRFLPIFLPALLWACGGRKHKEHGLVFSDWYIVKPVVESGITTAYGAITNTLTESTTLNAVSIDCADKAELHETIEAGGRVSMLALGSVTIPAGATVAFQPGKKHLMISGLRNLASGKCTATFTVGGRSSSFAIPVKDRKD